MLQTPHLHLRGARPPRKLRTFYVWLLKLLYHRWGNVSYMETVLAPRLHGLLDRFLQSGDDRLHALQSCGLGGDGPSLGGPFCLLNEDEVSSFKGQSYRTLDSMHSTVRRSSSVRGPPSAFSPPLAPPLPLAPPPLVPPPLGPSSLLPSLPLPAPTRPAPPKPDIAQGARQGEDGRRAQARPPSPCTCALQMLSGSLVHCKAEPRPRRSAR
jgi:hypothetical protein